MTVTTHELAGPERVRVLEDWNNTAAPFPHRKGVHHLFEEQARHSPYAPAVKDRTRALTYGELDRAASRLARRLRSLGARREAVVGLCLSRTVDMVVGMLGILKAGGMYLPLDPEYPADRLRFMLDDSGAPIVVTEDELAGRLPPHLLAVRVGVDGDPPANMRRGPDEDFDPSQPAYLIYTSGSTGRPKGVLVPHRAMVNFLTTMAARPGMGPTDALVAVTTLSFDIAGLELLLPLTVGAQVTIAASDEASDPVALAKLIDVAGATVMQATPSTWRMLIDAGWTGRTGLRVLCGGEALPVSLARALLERDLELWNMYGPTETTVWSLIARVTDPTEAQCIGRPIANTTVYILDRAMRPVPLGAEGELHIGGAGLAHGYLGRPELTAERFVAHPFDHREGARLYKTGDLARWRRDGSVEFLGRLDHQVKVRGFRIEPGEIEATLDAQPGVRASVVRAVEDGTTGMRLVAYLVAEQPAPTATELRYRLLQHLPSPMVPSAFVLLDALPLTPSGKVDRKALPAPEAARPALASTYVAPRNDVEAALCDIWSDVLGVEAIGVEDDFFQLGGHSLSSLRVVAGINRDFDVELGTGVLYVASTVAELASLVAASRGATQAPPLVALDRSTFIA